MSTSPPSLSQSTATNSNENDTQCSNVSQATTSNSNINGGTAMANNNELNTSSSTTLNTTSTNSTTTTSNNNNNNNNNNTNTNTNTNTNNNNNESNSTIESQNSTTTTITTNSAPSVSSNNNTSSTDNTTTTTNTSMNNSNNQDDVCRDYLRNVCRRGRNCRYKHPDVNDTELMKNKDPFVFCHDFQNRECRRDNCRFLHCTKQEEEIYRSTGKLPLHVQAQLPTDDRNSTPICKDFLNNTCRRGHRCKYRHPMPDSFHSPPSSRNGPYDGRNSRGSNYSMSNNPHNMEYQSPFSGRSGSTMMSSNYYNDNYSDTPNKRKRYDSVYHENNSPYSGSYSEPMSGKVRSSYLHSPNQPFYGSRSQSMESRSYLEEENAALRRRIDDLKKQVSELLSTNEYLMEQLNQIRASNTAVAVASACGPTSVASLQPQAAPGSVSSTAAVGMSAPITLQAQVAPPQAAAVAIGALPPVSIVSSIASISLPTVSAPVTLVNSSAAASLASFTPSMHSSNPWPLGVDQ